MLYVLYIIGQKFNNLVSEKLDLMDQVEYYKAMYEQMVLSKDIK